MAALIRRVDPHARACVLWAAAPPCQDFSRVASGQGHDGERGGLFLVAADFYEELKAELPDHVVVSLWENVVMNKKDADVVSKKLNMEPVIVCASDFGWISRPRLWWLPVEWEAFREHPTTGEAFHWHTRDGFRRLRLGVLGPPRTRSNSTGGSSTTRCGLAVS